MPHPLVLDSWIGWSPGEVLSINSPLVSTSLGSLCFSQHFSSGGGQLPTKTT